MRHYRPFARNAFGEPEYPIVIDCCFPWSMKVDWPAVTWWGDGYFVTFEEGDAWIPWTELKKATA